jgi:hypothetical protein
MRAFQQATEFIRGILGPRCVSVVDGVSRFLSTDGLIKFDARTMALCAICVFLFAGNVALKLQGSSVAMWNQVLPDEQPRAQDVLLGQPRDIRTDEWMIALPHTLSQWTRGYPVKNPNLGSGKAPLIYYTPVRHFTEIFRPRFYGFFLFDVERGYSFFWNYKTWGLLIAAFLLFSLLTKNSFWLSLFSAVWLLYSSSTQWWFSSPLPEIFIAASVVTVSCVYLLFVTSPRAILFHSVLLTVFFLDFALMFYPPFQVTLGYLIPLTVIGYALGRWKEVPFGSGKFLKMICLVGSAAVIALVLALFFNEAKETIRAMMQTGYPGRRVCQGGSMSMGQLFGGFFSPFFTEQNFPPKWSNICEASNYILLYPFLAVEVFRRWRENKRLDPLSLILLGYIVILTVWNVIGLPATLAKWTMFDKVRAERVIPAIGLANVMFVAVTLSTIGRSTLSFFRRNLIWSILVAIILLLYGFHLKSDAVPWLPVWGIVGISALFSAIAYFMVSNRLPLFYAFMALVLAPNLTINPVTAGLGAILHKSLFHFVQNIVSRDPSAGWAIFGDFREANFLMATGANVFNGTRFVPNLHSMAVLDPRSENLDSYNNYGSISLSPNESDSDAGLVRFSHPYSDYCAIQISPSSPKLQLMGIRYVGFTYMPRKNEIARLTPLSDMPFHDRVFLYRTITAPEPTPIRADTVRRQPDPIIERMQFVNKEYVIKIDWRMRNAERSGDEEFYLCCDGRYIRSEETVVSLSSEGETTFASKLPLARIGEGEHIIQLVLLNPKANYARISREYRLDLQ